MYKIIVPRCGLGCGYCIYCMVFNISLYRQRLAVSLFRFDQFFVLLDFIYFCNSSEPRPD